ncbi:putative EPIDERMAL PATTERNING FACTOR-like protein 2-like [Capsicum annuum]|nr:putative EPIDERMAL PATTERNING FACTOR-like protein 2-like [Capsicum annuum]
MMNDAELMLLGFISLLLTVSQDRILKICISKHLTNHWLPCKKDNDAKETVHFLTNFFSLVLGGRCLLVGSANSGYCGAKDKAPLLSLTALHHLHTFIFVLAISHVTFSALTILFEGLKRSFVKQFFGSVTKLDYTTLRLGFIMDMHGGGLVLSLQWSKTMFGRLFGTCVDVYQRATRGGIPYKSDIPRVIWNPPLTRWGSLQPEYAARIGVPKFDTPHDT